MAGMKSGAVGHGHGNSHSRYSHPEVVQSIAYNKTPALEPPEIGNRPIRQESREEQQELGQLQQLTRSKSRGRDTTSNGSEGGGRSRKNSLRSILARRPSQNRNATPTSTSHPPLPTRVPSAQHDTHLPGIHYTNSVTSTITSPVGTDSVRSRPSTSDRYSLFRSRSGGPSSRRSGSMLRKSSKLKAQAELERQQREAERKEATREPPRLPNHNPLPNMQTFGGEDARSDYSRPSYSSLNQAYTDPHSPPSMPAAANFSRPGTMAPHNNSSSSPNYAVRGASASASPPGVVNGIGESRTGSMTNRGRYSYASTIAGGSVNSPRRVRRRKDPTPFNVLIIGTTNSGKSSFINFLKHSLALPSHKQQDAASSSTQGSFTSHYLESEMEGERIGLTLWDSPGLEQNIVDLQLREMTAFIEAKFEDTFKEEQKVQRSPGFKDTHIHCVFYILDPVRLDSTIAAARRVKPSSKSGLDEEVDLQTLRALWGKTTVIPIISKADTVPMSHMAYLKRAVWDSVKTAKLNPLEALEMDEDDDLAEEDEDSDVLPASSPPDSDSSLDNSSESIDIRPVKRAGHSRQASLSAAAMTAATEEEPYIPMSILSPDLYDLPPYTNTTPTPENMVRKFAWGTASPFNAQHCDFLRLRDSIFAEWRADLRELSRTQWYETWRTSRLRMNGGPGSKQRAKGGVTPLGSVPREGRTTSGASSAPAVRNFSKGPSSVPRTLVTANGRGSQQTVRTGDEGVAAAAY